MGDESTTLDRDDDVHVRVLLPDGGEEEVPDEEVDDEENEEEASDDTDEEEEEGEQDDDESDDEDQEGDEDDGDEQDGDESDEEEGDGTEEGEVDEEDRDAAESEEGTRILHLNLDGLFLDLLGLEVDLDEVRLNVTAIPGDGKLLGNLLSAVGGLLDEGDLGSLLGLDDLLGDGGLLDDGEEEGEGSGLLPALPDPNVGERIESFANAIAERLRAFLGSIVDQLPLEELVTELIQAVVSELLGSDDDEDDGDEAASA